MSMAVHYSSATNEWATPQELFDRLDAEFNFTLDPCATPENAKCQKFYTKEQDGLSRCWCNEIVFMNPPYRREIGKWMAKAYESAQRGATVVCLIPSRTDTAYWHDYVWDSDRNCFRHLVAQVRFIQRRLRFSEGTIDAPFPSVIIVLTSLADAGRGNSNDTSEGSTTSLT
jgi:phage N-6-adenine-methyltransferase